MENIEALKKKILTKAKSVAKCYGERYVDTKEWRKLLSIRDLEQILDFTAEDEPRCPKCECVLEVERICTNWECGYHDNGLQQEDEDG